MAGIELRINTRNNWLKDSGYTLEEEGKIYEDMLLDIFENPRWYLDNFYYMREFRVRWINYTKQNTTRPLKFVKTKHL